MKQTIELFIRSGKISQLPNGTTKGLIKIKKCNNKQAIFYEDDFWPVNSSKNTPKYSIGDKVYFFAIPTIYFTDHFGTYNQWTISAINIRKTKPKLIEIQEHPITGQPCNTLIGRKPGIRFDEALNKSVYQFYCINDFGFLSIVEHDQPSLPKNKVITISPNFVVNPFNKNINIPCGTFKEADDRYTWK